MAKRSRGSSRPGQRRPVQRAGARPLVARPATATPRPSSLTSDEEARAAELEARILEEERAAEAATRRTRDRARRGDEVGPGPRGAASLAVRAAADYAYVVRDVRRIVTVAAFLLIVLIALWAILGATGARG